MNGTGVHGAFSVHRVVQWQVDYQMSRQLMLVAVAISAVLSSSTAWAGDPVSTKAESAAKQTDREKISQAEMQLEREKQRDRIIESVFEALESHPSKTNEKVIKNVLDALGLHSGKRLEREIEEQYYARRLHELVVERETTTPERTKQTTEAIASLEKFEAALKGLQTEVKSTLDFEWKCIEAQAEELNRLKKTAQKAFPQRLTETELKSRVSQAKDLAAKEVQRDRDKIPVQSEELAAERLRATGITRQLSQMVWVCPNGLSFHECTHPEKWELIRKRDEQSSELRKSESRIRQLEAQLARANRRYGELKSEVEAAGARQAEEDHATIGTELAAEAAIDTLQKLLTVRTAKFEANEAELSKLELLLEEVRQTRSSAQSDFNSNKGLR